MADFKKYNGYNVKDASALAHASISGNTLTTTNREGNVVDTLTLPGGSSNISATSMAYHNPSIDKAYSQSVNALFIDDPDMNLPYTTGQVLSDEMIGYGEVTYDTGLYTLGSIYAQTIRSWDTYDRTDMMGGAGQDTNNVGDVDSFENNASLLHRKARYKTYLRVGKNGVYTTVAANSAKRIMITGGGGSQILTTIPVKAPNGAVQGYATIVGVTPLIKCDRSGSTIEKAGLIMYYNKNGAVVAYNATAADIRVDSFLLELEVILESQYCDDRSWISNDPYIKYLNIEKPTADFTQMQVNTNVIVHSAIGTTDKKLFEYRLTKSSSGVWSWTATSVAIPDTSSSTYYNTKITRQLTNSDDFCSAVAYAIGVGTSVVGDAFFTDALPLPQCFIIE